MDRKLWSSRRGEPERPDNQEAEEDSQAEGQMTKHEENVISRIEAMELQMQQVVAELKELNAMLKRES
jgi:hypothetical protein